MALYIIYYVLPIFVVFSLWYLKVYLKWRTDIYNMIEKIPGPKAYPFVGTLSPFIFAKRSEIWNIFFNITVKYQPFFRTWSGSLPEIHVMKPEHLEQIMSSSTHISKGELYKFVKPWLGDGLLISSGSKWHKRRKMITPTFHFKILEQFMQVFVEKSKLLVESLETKINSNFNVYPLITHCALDIICETAMGVQMNSMSNSDNYYIKAIYQASEQIIQRFLVPWYQSDLYYLFPEGRAFKKNLNILHSFTNKVISDRRQILKQTTNQAIQSKPNKKHLSFLDLLLEASTTEHPLSDIDIREEVDTFMFEGHDTTTAAICWGLFLLANNQDIQERAYKEVKSVLGNKKTPESINELNELKYLEQCVKETLRLFPSVAFISRTLSEDVYIDGKRIPKGVQCNLHIYHVHRNPKYYPEPEKYDPDRFLPENCAGRHPYAYIPFSAGPRNCIGQKFAMLEEKTVLASIIRSYKILAVDTMDSINLVSELILRPENGIRIKLQKRV